MGKIIKTTAEDFKNHYLEKKARKKAVEENKILKSKKRGKLLCSLEYVSIILTLNILDKFNRSGYSKYSYYHVSYNTINKLENKGFIVYDDGIYGYGITGRCFRLQISRPFSG